MRLMTPLALILLVLVGSVRPVSANPLLLFDATTGEVLLSRDAGAKWHPASLTKLMTAYLTFQSLKAGQLTLDTKLTVPQEALDVSPSKIGLKPGSTITTDLALKALLIYSANDMALTLAAAQGGIPAFVQRMNDTARALNMGSTHFVNPHGLHDPEQTTSARDIGLLAFTIANRYPEYRHYFSEPYVAFGKRKLLNRNMLLRQMPTADGMKTGFVCPSGFNLVASATQNGRRLIAVVMGAMTAYSRADIAQALLEAGFVAGQRQTKQLVSQIADEPTPPPNLKPMVCGTGIPVAKSRPGQWLGRVARPLQGGRQGRFGAGQQCGARQRHAARHHAARRAQGAVRQKRISGNGLGHAGAADDRDGVQSLANAQSPLRGDVAAGRRAVPAAGAAGADVEARADGSEADQAKDAHRQGEGQYRQGQCRKGQYRQGQYRQDQRRESQRHGQRGGEGRSLGRAP